MILRFWKQRGAEPLYVAQPFNFQPIACNGMPVSYDLVTGAKTGQTQNPTVQFTMARTPESLPQQNKPKFDWLFTVEIPGGMIQRTTTNMAFLAPSDGYVSATNIGFKADDLGWSSDTRAVFFYKTGQGQFGRLDLRVTSALSGSNASFEWTSYLNPSGSPGLEYDPAKKLKAPSGTSSPASQGGTQPPLPAVTVPQPPTQKGSAPFVPSPPPGFQALTNRGKAFAPPVPPRP